MDREAFERARSAYGTGAYDDATLEFLFPQLKESEDERIRKGIIEIIKAVSGPDCDVYLDEKKQEKYIAWLEKQKEQEWNRKPCLTCQEYNEGFEAGRLEGVTAGYNKAMKEMEQKEQKPWKVGANAYFTPEQKPEEVDESTKRLNDNWMKQHFDDYEEQKPAWSEEDEEMLEEIINHIDTTSVQRIPARPGSAIGKSWIKFLKSLRPQPKQEWSEEDVDMLNSCISSIEEAKENRYAYKETDGDTSYDYEIAWLKSLRPSWKPSEVHLSALLAVFNDPNNIGSQTCQLALTDLYEQLKKMI